MISLLKGLEFDSVYIILDGFRIINNDTTSVKKPFICNEFQSK